MLISAGPGKIIVKFVPKRTQSNSGIFMPEATADQEIVESELVADSLFEDKNTGILPDNTKIVFARGSAGPIEVNGETYLILSRNAILVAYEEEEEKEKEDKE